MDSVIRLPHNGCEGDKDGRDRLVGFFPGLYFAAQALAPGAVGGSGVAGPRCGPAPEGLVEFDLADSHRLGGDLDTFVLAAELQRLLK